MCIIILAANDSFSLSLASFLFSLSLSYFFFSCSLALLTRTCIIMLDRGVIVGIFAFFCIFKGELSLFLSKNISFF